MKWVHYTTQTTCICMYMFCTGMWKLSCFDHRGGWEYDDTPNTHWGNKRKNASPTTLTFHQWKAVGSGLSLLLRWVSGNQCTFSTLRRYVVELTHFYCFNDCHSSFLWNHLHGTNLVTMWYGINNPKMKKFEDFLLHDFPHRIIEPTLRLSRRCTRRVNRNAMGIESWANPFEILQRIPEDRRMFL